MSHAPLSPLSRPLGFECYPAGLGPSRRAFLRAVAATAAGAATTGALPGCDTAPATQDAAPEPAPAESAADALDSVPVFPEGGFAEDAVRIGFNENPLGPSPKALAAIAADGLAAGHRYNYPETVRDRIAAHHGARRENVLVGCGSTEFLQFLPWGFLKPGTTSLVLPEITYGWCGGVAASIGAEVIRTPMGPEGTLDVGAMRAAIRPDTRIVYLANPNNPTGAAVSGDEIASLAEAVPEGGILIVDEAYAEFLPEDAVSMALAGGPVIVARTFSKAYGMAGLRFGYVIGSGPMFEKATGVWWGDFGLNTAAATACGPALDDQGARRELRADRGRRPRGAARRAHRAGLRLLAAPGAFPDDGPRERGPAGGVGTLPARDLRPGRRRLGPADVPPDLGRPLRAAPGAAGSAPGDPGRLRAAPVQVRQRPSVG